MSGPADRRLRWLGHATVLLELAGTRLLTDPLLGGRLWHLVRAGPPVEPDAYERLDGVLVSHLHHDHFDVASLRRLARDTPLLLPAGGGALARRQGFREVAELRPGDELSIGAVTITALPAEHDGRRRPFGPAADALGYLLSAGTRVLFAGDTDLFDGMADLRGRVDVALLPVWGWGPSLGPGHLNPDTAAQAVRLVRPRLAIPIHWGTFLPAGLRRLRPELLSEPPRRFARRAALLAPDVEVRLLEPGEGTALPGPDPPPLPSGRLAR